MINLLIEGILPDHTNFNLQMPVNCTILDIKVALCRLSRIPVKCQLLSIQNKLVDNSQELRKCCAVKANNQDHIPISLIIRPLLTYDCNVDFGGDFFEMEFEPSDSIQDLCDQVKYYLHGTPDKDIPYKLILGRKEEGKIEGIELNPQNQFGQYAFSTSQQNNIYYQNIKDQVTVNLLHSQNQEKKLTFNKTQSVMQVKAAVAKEINMQDVRLFVLMLNGNDIDAQQNKRVSDLIKENDTLTIMQKVAQN